MSDMASRQNLATSLAVVDQALNLARRDLFERALEGEDVLAADVILAVKSGLKAAHRDANEEWITVGNIAVDTATLVIADPINLDKAAGEWSKALHEELSESETGIAQLDTVNPHGTIALALAPTGWGDGFYPVEVRYEDNHIAELRIKFMPHPQFGDLSGK
jgi:hypothetical protein